MGTLLKWVGYLILGFFGIMIAVAFSGAVPSDDAADRQGASEPKTSARAARQEKAREEQQERERVNLEAAQDAIAESDFEQAALALRKVLSTNERRVELASTVADGLRQQLRGIPASNIRKNADLYDLLTVIDPDDGRAKERLALYRQKIYAEENAPKLADYQIKILDWTCAEKYGRLVAAGRIQNISSQKIENVQAVATFTTSAERFVSTDTALIEYRPLLPGQSSPFEVIGPRNPLAERCAIEFARFSGPRLAACSRASCPKE